jgi:hypothetical protein
LSNDSAAVVELKTTVDDTAKRYAELRRQQSQRQRDAFGVALGAIFSLCGIGLAAYASYKGNLSLLWDILAIPLMLLGIPGFFYELSGGRSRQKDTDERKSKRRNSLVTPTHNQPLSEQVTASSKDKG